MITNGPKRGFAFVIDTDSYAGNFEREMTAHITGEIGECEVGKEFIEELDFENGFDSNIQQVPDENYCYRPTAIVPEPSTANPDKAFPYGEYNSVAIFFYDMPTQNEIDMMKERSHSFNDARKQKDSWYKDKDKINILGFRMVEFSNKQKVTLI